MIANDLERHESLFLNEQNGFKSLDIMLVKFAVARRRAFELLAKIIMLQQRNFQGRPSGPFLQAQLNPRHAPHKINELFYLYFLNHIGEGLTLNRTLLPAPLPESDDCLGRAD